MRKILSVMAAVTAVLMLIAPAMADVSNPPTQHPRDVLTAVFFQPGSKTATGTTTTYTGVTMVGNAFQVDASNVDQFSQADVFVTGAISGSAYMTVTPQFSNDWLNWRSAALVTIQPAFYAFYPTSTVGTLVQAAAITSTPIVWSLSTTDTVGYPISVQGTYMRFKIVLTNNGANTFVNPLIRVTFKNYGQFN